MKILAMDVGKSKTVGYAVYTATGEAAFETVVTTPTVIRRWMQKRRPDRVVMEIGPLAGWIHDAVRAEGVREVQVANANHEAWRWRNVRRKNDRLDAAKLADLSAAGQLPTVHMPTAAVRQWRQLIAYRNKVGDRRTAIKDSIRSILAAVGANDRRGHISRQGCRLARKLLVEVAWMTVRYNPHFRQMYGRLHAGSPARKKIAIVGVARHLAVTMWAMLRDGTSWCPPASDSEKPSHRPPVPPRAQKRTRTTTATTTARRGEALPPHTPPPSQRKGEKT